MSRSVGVEMCADVERVGQQRLGVARRRSRCTSGVPPFSNDSMTVTVFDELAVAVSAVEPVPTVAVPSAVAVAAPSVRPARVPNVAVCRPGESVPRFERGDAVGHGRVGLRRRRRP